MGNVPIFPGGMFVACVVLSNDSICPEHYRIRLGMKSFPSSRPGQFINIQCTEWRDSGVRSHIDVESVLTPSHRPVSPDITERVPLLRRPFSLAGRTDQRRVELDILYRVVGVGSNWISNRKIGDEVNILGPLGNGFTVRDDKPHAVIIGGGTGIGPMLYLAESLRAAGKAVSAFAGARTASATPLTEEQKGAFAITTDDGSLGQAGMVHEAFKDWLEREKPTPTETVVYACGPEAMMKAVSDICAPAGIECQLAMERYMACGMGVCQGCNVKVKTDEPPGWKFKLVCKDGPVFDAGELLWE